MPADPAQAEREFQECCPCAIGDHACVTDGACNCEQNALGRVPDDVDTPCLWPGHKSHARAVLAARIDEHPRCGLGECDQTCVRSEYLTRELAAMEWK